MSKQVSKVCFSLFIMLSLLANYCISENSSEQYGPTASESENKSTSSESYVSVPPSTIIPDVETESDQTLPPENVSTLTNANLDQQLAPSPFPTIETKGGNNITPSPSPSIVDNSILDTRDMDSISQENASVPLSNADPPAAEDVFQENASLPPTSIHSSSPPSLSPAYLDAPAFETTDGGSFTQENHSPSPSNTVSETTENVPQLNDYSSLPNDVVPAPSEALSYPELDPTMQLTPSNDYTLDSAPTTSDDHVHTTLDSAPTSDDHVHTTLPSNDYTLDSAPTSDDHVHTTLPSKDYTLDSAPTSDDHVHTTLQSNYRAEDEPVEPYEDEEDSWNGGNGAVAGVFVGACVIGVGGFMYQKKKKDKFKAQYESLAKKDDA